MTQDAKEKHASQLAGLTPAQRQYLSRQLSLQPADTSTTGNTHNGQLAACVKLKPHANLDLEELRKFARTRLPDYMVPRQFFQVEELPRTAAGKIDRSAVAEYCRDMPKPRPAESNVLNPHGFSAARNETEATLAAIWASVLGVYQVAIDDDFYEIGGDSLLSIRIMARANKAGLHISPEDFFARPTIAGQAQLLTQADGKSQAEAENNAAPLAPIQHWFLDRVKPHPQHCSQYLRLRVASRLDFSSLQSALQQLLVRHAVLRTAFVENDNLPTQLVSTPGAGLPLQKHVVAASSAPEIESLLDAEADKITRNFDLARGNLVQLRFVEDPGGEDNWLLLVIHPLLVDPQSWQILLADLYTLWSGAASGKRAELSGRATSYLDWCRQLQALAQAETLLDQQQYWQHLPLSGSKALPLVSTDANGSGNPGDMVAVALAADSSDQLKQCVASYHAEIQEALLAAVAYAILRQQLDNAQVIDLHTSARAASLGNLDTGSMVGWIAACYPTVLTAQHEVEPGELLRWAKETLRKMPLQGLGYGVLKYLGDAATGARVKNPAQVCFRYIDHGVEIPRFGGELSPCSSDVMEIRHPDNQLAYPLEINVRSIGSQLRIECAYNRNLHTRAAVESLAHACIDFLQQLIRAASENPGNVFTPSDFPLAGLDQNDLDNIAGQISDFDDEL